MARWDMPNRSVRSRNSMNCSEWGPESTVASARGFPRTAPRRCRTRIACGRPASRHLGLRFGAADSRACFDIPSDNGNHSSRDALQSCARLCFCSRRDAPSLRMRQHHRSDGSASRRSMRRARNLCCMIYVRARSVSIKAILRSRAREDSIPPPLTRGSRVPKIGIPDTIDRSTYT